jgi:orotidine-5'-phosphate decarboxylase
MTNYQALVQQIQRKQSMLCIGLDTDTDKIPSHHHYSSSHPELTFNQEILNATPDLCVAYKLNIAFYEQMGIKGWQLLADTLDHIPDDILVIADAKRGDIGNTSRKYAETFFNTFQFDAVTVSPYMGRDSIAPFLEFTDKWTIVLGLTSNEGSQDFQAMTCNGQQLYEHVVTKASQWAGPEQLMIVTGATHPSYFQNIRHHVPHHFMLVPGIGKQGGDVSKVLDQLATADCGVLINAARSIIYADTGEQFAEAAREEAQQFRDLMKPYIRS